MKSEFILRVIPLILVSIVFITGIIQREYHWCYISLLLINTNTLTEILDILRKGDNK